MSRNTITSKLKVISATVCLTAALAGAAVILEDDFTNQAVSSSKWLNSLDNEMMPVTVSGGSININNKSQYGGEYYHTFSGAKPSAFTITFTLGTVTGTDADAGVLFCRSAGFNGYYLTALNHPEHGNMVALFKYVNGSGTTIYYTASGYLKASDNKFTVSKSSAGEINIFVNDEWQGTVTDTQFPSGDVSLMVSPHTNAAFGSITMTDQATPGGMRTAFSDDFNSGARKGAWIDRTSTTGIQSNYSVSNGALTIATPVNAGAWSYVDVSLADNFEVSVAVRHIAGGVTVGDFYGIVIAGSDPSPMIHFCITGNKNYDVWIPGGNISSDKQQSNAIKGASNDAAVINIDTLTVRKKAGASTYEFLVNGEVLPINYPVAAFPITGAGIFVTPQSTNNLTILFDDFYAGPIGGTSVSFHRSRQQSIRKGAALRNPNPVFYDLRGRRSYSRAAAAGNSARTKAAGVYVSENGREVMTRKGRR